MHLASVLKSWTVRTQAPFRVRGKLCNNRALDLMKNVPCRYGSRLVAGQEARPSSQSKLE
jgi:hypothetical protein